MSSPPDLIINNNSNNISMASPNSPGVPGGGGGVDLSQEGRQKRLKAGTACTNCRRKKLRCTGTPMCARCTTHGLECVVDEVLFLKTNSPQSLQGKPVARSSSFSSSNNNNNNTGSSSSHRPSKSHHHGNSSHHQHHNNSSNNNNGQPYNSHYNHQQHSNRHNNYNNSNSNNPSSYQGSVSSPSVYSDEGMEPADYVDSLSDRRMSASSATSLSSMSPSPSPGYSYGYSDHGGSGNSYHYGSNNNSNYGAPSSSSSSSKPRKSSHSRPKDSSSGGPAGTFSSSASNPLHTNKKRSSKDQGTTKQHKQKRRNSRENDDDPRSPSPLPEEPRYLSSSNNNNSNRNNTEGRSTSTSTSTAAGTTGTSTKGKDKDEDFKSVVSTMSLDGHGQHFHGSSSGFYVCQLSSRYRQGVYPLPMAHLNDSDLWSHSLQMTSERELPSKPEMDNLLGLYFRYMYPFAPMFIRRTFMEHHNTSRPDLSQILILNAIFCNACWYSDDPVVRQDSTKFFNRAKIILDETYHVSRVSTVQALLLMSHHQYAVGNYSGGWLYTGMATRIAHDIGLHRQDVQGPLEPEEAEVRKRVWWAVYIADRLGGGILGRPLNLRDKEYNVQMPSDDWIAELGGDDAVEYPYEPERIISCRLLWTVKLFMQMGNVLNTMHCIEAEINGAFLADISRTQLPQLHNSLTSWFLSLPNELMYTPYTMSPNSNHPPSPPTALMHMFYYTCLTMLHRPYLRPVNSAAIDANFLVSSRNICTAAATNVCHIADSLMLHGQLRDTCYYGMACLLAAGTVHVHNAITPTPSNRETTRAGLSKTVKAAHELVKTFPVAESLIAVALDVFASQTSSVPTEMAASFIDISTFVAPFIDLTQLQSTSIGNIYEAARLAKLAKDGPGPAPSIQLRHPYGNFSMPLPESSSTSGSNDKEKKPANLSSMWQSHISTAVAMAAIAFGGSDPQQEQQFFANPLELPEALRLAPIDQMMFQVDGTTTGGPGGFGTDPTMQFSTSIPTTTTAAMSTPTTHGNAGFPIIQGDNSHLLQYQNMSQQQQQSMHSQQQDFHQQQHQQQQHQQQQHQQQHQQHQQQQQQQQAQQLQPQHTQQQINQVAMGMMQSSVPHFGSTSSSSSPFSASQALSLMQAALASSLQVSDKVMQSPPLQTQQPQQSQQLQAQHQQPPQHMHAPQHQQQQQQQQEQQNVVMEDDTADPPSPPAISSDDMDMESASLSDDTPSPAPRVDAQVQVESQMLTQQEKHVEKVNTLLFGNQIIEC
ncbi:hypothetical protein BGZ83_007224 [Gryganskiella cystojenkinii]|nr:hypothetical protein BGZ83_007224 [Gryganskiella cystojenkinii]